MFIVFPLNILLVATRRNLSLQSRIWSLIHTYVYDRIHAYVRISLYLFISKHIYVLNRMYQSICVRTDSRWTDREDQFRRIFRVFVTLRSSLLVWIVSLEPNIYGKMFFSSRGTSSQTKVRIPYLLCSTRTFGEYHGISYLHDKFLFLFFIPPYKFSNLFIYSFFSSREKMSS